MKRKYFLIPLLLFGGLLLAACVSSVTSNPDPADTGSPATLPGDTLDSPGVEGSEPSLDPSAQSSPAPAEEGSAPTTAPVSEPDKEYEIITLLPFDAIPAIDNPQFLSAEDADAQYAPEDLVMGVVFDGEARAYSIAHLSRHEIVNDTISGRKIAVTW